MTKVLSVARIVQCSTVLSIFFLSAHLWNCTWQRGISRPHTQATDRPADFYFARKIIQPCGVGRDLLESVTREEVINMVHLVWEELQANLARIINTHTSRYASFEMRRMRDCALLSQAGEVLDRLHRFYSQ